MIAWTELSQPTELLLVDRVSESGWANSIDDQKFRESFQKLVLTRSLAKSVIKQDNEDAVHLIVTANYVTLNWVFFDRQRPQDNARPINVPRSLFDKPAKYCFDLFAAALKVEYGFEAEKNTVQFWKVSYLGFS